MTISKSLKKFGGKISKNSPTILTGLAIIGIVGSVISSVKATPKALLIIEEEERRVAKIIEKEKSYGTHRIYESEISNWDIIKLTWHCYIPTMLIVGITCACVIGADHINRKRYAALLGIYTITEATLNKYQSKVVDFLGKKKEQELRDEISADYIEENPPNFNEIIETGTGVVICYNPLSKDYFYSDMEHIRRVIADLNDNMFNGNFVNLNDLYHKLGIPRVRNGNLIGWDEHTGLLKPYYSWTTYNGFPCMVLNFEINPRFI